MAVAARRVAGHADRHGRSASLAPTSSREVVPRAVACSRRSRACRSSCRRRSSATTCSSRSVAGRRSGARGSRLTGRAPGVHPDRGGHRRRRGEHAVLPPGRPRRHHRRRPPLRGGRPGRGALASGASCSRSPCRSPNAGSCAGIALAFARALGDFGTTIMVAGNVPGRTQTMPDRGLRPRPGLRLRHRGCPRPDPVGRGGAGADGRLAASNGPRGEPRGPGRSGRSASFQLDVDLRSDAAVHRADRSLGRRQDLDAAGRSPGSTVPTGSASWSPGVVVDEVRRPRRTCPPQDRQLGMVTQASTLLPHRTVLRNVALAVRDGDRRRAERRGPGLARPGRRRRPGPTAARPRSPAGSSNGSRSLGPSPGDPGCCCSTNRSARSTRPSRTALRGLVRRLAEETATPVLLVTHDPTEALTLADHLAVDRGRSDHPAGTPGRGHRPARGPASSPSWSG